MASLQALRSLSCSHQTPYSTTRTSWLKFSSAPALKFHGVSPDKTDFDLSVFTLGIFKPNQKETMQNLNNRLASYMDKVRTLEKANEKLESQIKEKLAKVSPVRKDHGPLFAQIIALRNEIAEAVKNNFQLQLQIGNNQLAKDDFKQKWEFAFAECETYKKDLQMLQKDKKEHEARCDLLGVQLESLEDELLSLKKTHQEELAALKASLVSPQVDVEIDAVHGPDLALILAEIRTKYEAIVQKNKEDAETWFKFKVSTLPVQSWKENEALQGAKTELSEKKRNLKSLQIMLESLKKQVNALDGSLQETEFCYSTKLHELQKMIANLEKELAEMKYNMQSQKHEYEALFRIKETLEAEIEVYRRLLEGDFQKKLVAAQPVVSDVKTRKIVKIVTQTLVNGELIDMTSDIKEVEDST
uniref:Keratin, type I cytoskeletal 18-like n=1 Tax=Geotrypetes seraphini TaxID=260995 RepID=A0A6P8SB37_GEOSA|nr:keratin, type I cytoskeletal 18-like [Geotrypetes seraphini]XP_033815804.1 keratin, type I cytoskeletal 18-like [Geotrypetes seraphini]XP_033815805.1 keratin, type I cytoskeletal 18-like [Geotrypetes seraphini]XP_033815806.1 keratin, type I cytoskeletal 18-like [Geotrypetes seraphini]